MPPADPFDAKRTAMREEFFDKLFLLGGWIGATDTYKRTMWAAVPDIAVQHACYTLTFRKPLPEPGAGNQLIMAGHEAMLAQWFRRPLRRSDIELARRWHKERANVRAFPDEAWDAVLAGQPGEDVFLPVEWSLIFAKGIRDCRLLVEPFCGHWVQYERRDSFNHHVGQFLREG